MDKLLYPVSVSGINYLVDKDAEIPIGGYGIHNWEQYRKDYPKADELLLCTESNCASIQEHWNKAVAVESPNKVEGLYQFKLPDEDEHKTFTEQDIYDVAETYIRAGYKGWFDDMGEFQRKEFLEDVKRKFIDSPTYGINSKGYKANKGYSEQDMWNCYIEGKTKGNYYTTNEFKKYIQSLNKPKEVESVVVDYEMIGNPHEWVDTYKLDENGLLVISKINWK